ncbi:MAG: fatty acid desaturase [Planctomycetota bacterium]|nr:MAG: fatty acid desaturase [Planctomycetota bacterium]
MLTVGGMVLVTYLLFLGQVGVHNCIHGSMFPRNPTWNRWFGEFVCSLCLMCYGGWRAAHVLHHRYTNTDMDPHCVDRPFLAYMLSHTWRIARKFWSWKALGLSLLPPLALCGIVIGARWQWAQDWLGLRWILLFWFIPVVLVHFIMAHFNWVTHVGLPTGSGRDTRNLTAGLWPWINRLSFNFYLHAEHHREPLVAIPKMPAGPPMKDPAGKAKANEMP